MRQSITLPPLIAATALASALLLLQLALSLAAFVAAPGVFQVFGSGMRSLLAVAVPVGLASYVGSAWLCTHGWRFAHRSSVSLVLVWLVATTVAWLLLYSWLGGTDPSLWSGAIFTTPELWYPTLFGALGLYVGSARHIPAGVA